MTASLAPATTVARVQSCWRDVVGETVAEESRPVSERAGVVTVACRSAVWAQELDLMGPELARRLNSELGGTPVESLRFVVGTEP